MQLLLALPLFSFVGSITPGPNNIMIMSSGLNFGIKKSLPHALGICLGFPVMFIVTGLCLNELFVQFPAAHHSVKIIGATYMLYLAYKIARSSVEVDNVTSLKPLTFLSAFLFQWINPKAWVIRMSAIAAYTIPDANIVYQVSLICLIFMMTGIIPSVGVWLFFGAFLKKILKTPAHRKYFNYTMSTLLVISIILIFIGNN
jgi:threonine/homoserine/homoserine lactone efflux protein